MMAGGPAPRYSGGNDMADPSKEPQVPKKDELSIDELDAATGGNGITQAETDNTVKKHDIDTAFTRRSRN
jgi:hypothetical protein